MRKNRMHTHLGMLGATILGLAVVVSSPRWADAQIKDQRHLVEIGLLGGMDFLNTKHGLFDAAAGHEKFESPAFELGLRGAYLPFPYLGVELETALTFTDTRPGGYEDVMLYSVRGHVLGQYPVWRELVLFGVAGGGLLGVRSQNAAVGDDLDWAAHWGLGVKYHIESWMGLRLDLRHILSDGHQDKVTHHFAVLAGVSFVLGWKADKDKDGICDAQDKCPQKFGDKPHGCPDSDGDEVPDHKDKCPQVKGDGPDGCVLDSDGDEVPDASDACRNKAGDKPHGCPDSDGDEVPDHKDKCPKVKGDGPDGCGKDRDSDGVWDARDQCPDKAGPKPHGCPDGDGDEVPDHKDKCPKVKGDGPDGCLLDSDGDSIPDQKDKCPKKPETPNGFQDQDGCPDELPKEVARFSGTIKGIYFAKNSAKIRRRSYRILNRAIAVLKKYPKLRIKVRGHTDNRGKHKHNMRLSSARAQAIKTYLVGKGIAGSRIETEGVGPKEPVASNKRSAGRAKNRRIEFKILR